MQEAARKGYKMMRRALMIGFALILAASVCFAESVPNGECADILTVKYNEDLLSGWNTMLCPDAAGMLFTAYTDTAEICVSVDEIGLAKSALEFLDAQLSNISRYGRVISREGPFDWESEAYLNGAGIRYHYQYINGGAADDEYVSRVFAAPYSYGYYAIFSVNCWGTDAEETADWFEGEFLPSARVESLHASAFFTAFLKDVRVLDSGCVEVSLDFCNVAFDPEIFTIYAGNPEPTEYRYALSEDAEVYLPNAGSALYSVCRWDGSAEALQKAVSADSEPGIYRVLFGENNEILWMMHYNAL